MNTEFWPGNMKETDNLHDPDLDGRITLRWIFKECDEVEWTGAGSG
jgi:hypothetical protein